MTLWGFAKMDKKHPDLFEVAKARIVSLLPSFEPHRLCNTVWAYAKMQPNDNGAFFRSMAEEALKKAGKFNTSNISMLL